LNLTRTIMRFGRSNDARIMLLALGLATILSLSSPYFLTSSNVYNLLDQSVVVGIVALGMTFVILTGGIDLSVGSVAGLTGIILGLSMREVPFPVAIAIALTFGALIGTFSGTLVSVFGLAPFVVTLGMMSICRSLAYVTSGQQSISNLPPGLSKLVYGSVLGIPANVFILLCVYAIAWAYLNYTKGGRTIYALGSNYEAARVAGLSVVFYKTIPYAISGALSALAITLVAAQIRSIDPLAGNMMELDAIAAVVIGGASLFGGRGTVIGTLFGVFIMVMVRNWLNLVGVSAFWQGSAIGAIIIVAVLVERLLSRR
jgi:ribose transport system permease protein